jgi:hypothetical protein
MEGLTVSYGHGESTLSGNTDGDQQIMKASYAYGPITVSASNNDYEHTTAANNQEVVSYARLTL